MWTKIYQIIWMLAEPAEQLCLFICVPNQFMRQIKVRKSDPCGTLMRFCGTEDAALFHNGQPLDRNSTFGDYNINQSDSIVIINKVEKYHEMNRWVNTSRDSEDLNNMISSVMSQKTHRDVLRKMDNFVSKMEVKPQAFRKMVARYREKTESVRPCPVIFSRHETILLPSGTEPSEEPLPVPW